MAEREIETVREYFALLSRQAIDEAMAGVDEDFVLDRRNSNAPWRGFSRGRAAAKEAYAAFYDAWDTAETVSWETTKLRSVGRGMVTVGTRVAATGRASGIEIAARGGWLVIFRAGRVAEAILHQSFDEALADGRRRALAHARLYFVCDGHPHREDPRPLLDAALGGGADLIQLREKGLSDEELIAAARPFREAADEHGALFILNDRPDLVGACRADGVHVGQDDLSVAEARAAAGPGALVGLSTHSAAEVTAAVAADGDARPDQISVGPIWETPTKEGRPATGLELIAHAADAAGDLPWFAIGGIDASNVAEVVAAGATRIVVVRAIRDAADPEAAARQLRGALDDPPASAQ